MAKDPPDLSDGYIFLELISHRISRWVGGSSALVCVITILLFWLMLGPFMHFAPEWHLLIGTTSAAITFLMLFVLARGQVKDTMSIQIKLNEIIGVLKGANNELINIEGLSESRIAEVSKRYEAVAEHLHNQPETVSIEAIVAHEIVEEMEAVAEAVVEAEAREHEREKSA